MINIKLKSKGLKQLAALTFSLLFLAAAAQATVVTVSCSPSNTPANPLLASGGGNLAAGAFVQVVQSTDGSASQPDLATGQPSSPTDTVVNTGTLSAPGTFTKGGNNIPNGTYVYLVAWETWNGVGAPSGTYGISAVAGPMTSPSLIWRPSSTTTNTDLPQPTLTLTAPAGGNNLRGGQNQDITWTSSNFTGNVKIDYSTNGGTSYDNTIVASTTDDGSQSWVVPSLNSSTVRVRVSDAADGDPSSTSSSDFTIDSANPAFSGGLSPAGGETLIIGNSFNITWTPATDSAPGSGFDANPIRLDYSTNGGASWVLIVAAAANDGSHSWTIPSAPTTQGRIRFTATDRSGNSSSIPSPANFTIQAAPVISRAPASLTFSGVAGGANPAAQTITITNTGGGALSWTASENLPWLSIIPSSGAAPSTISVSVDTADLTPAGSPYTGAINLTSNGGSSSVAVTLTLTAAPNQNPPAPALVAPADSASGIAVRPTFNWNDVNDPDGDTVTYTLQVSTNASFTGLVINQAVADDNSAAYSFTPTSDLANSLVYYWRVIAADSNGGAANSSARSFTTVAAVNPPNVSNVHNKAAGTSAHYVYVTPYNPDWQPGDPIDDSLTLIIRGARFGENAPGDDNNELKKSPPANSRVDFTARGLSGAAAIMDDPANLLNDRLYWWRTDKIEASIADRIGTSFVVAGPASLQVFTPDGSSNIYNFEVRARVYGAAEPSAAPGEAVTLNGTAFGADPEAVTLTINGAPAVVTAATNGTLTFTLPELAATDEVEAAVTINGVTSAFDLGGFSVAETPEAGNNEPRINAPAVTQYEAGQTIILTGDNFGDAPTETVPLRFGTTPATPLEWSNNRIVVAVPPDTPTGSNVELTVNTSNGSDSILITINRNSIYIDDYEGGCVGNFTGTATQSGYYVFRNAHDITPNNANINAQLRQSSAAKDGNLGAQVKYSYVSDDGTAWGGGWGARLVNTLDLANAQAINLYLNWDGSNNTLKFGLQDSDGTAVTTLISNATLQTLNGANYGLVTLNKVNFSYDPAGTIAEDADAVFDWTQVTNYNFLYTTNNTSNNYHKIDSIIASLTGAAIPQPTGEVVITSINPGAAPAGTAITVIGSGFGASQGQSALIFENISTHVSYQAEIQSWGPAEIRALIPRLAVTGQYTAKVIKVGIAAGIIRAQESNPAGFQVTANAAAEGSLLIYPNPFNPLAGGAQAQGAQAATVTFAPGTATNVGLYVYDMTAKLVHHKNIAGGQTSWNGYDDYQNLLGDGVYFIRVIDEDSKHLIAKGKILIIKQE